MQQRIRKNQYLALFDGADPSSSTGARLPSTTPLQALFLMNDPLAHHAAAKLAERMIAAGSDEASRIQFAFSVALGRSADSDEQKSCVDFLRNYREKLTALKSPANQIDQAAWSALARALLSSNEFVFVD